jgi:hypothetical protein
MLTNAEEDGEKIQERKTERNIEMGLVVSLVHI